MLNVKKGFTLVELLIVIAIISILATVAYPSYTDSVKKARRADAINGLMALAGRMEEFYMNADTYDGADVPTLLGSNDSPDKYYILSLTGETAFYYKLVATPVITDTECLTLTLDSLGVKAATGSDAANCW